MLPAGTGPHEGMEFELIRAGRKNVALFIDYAPPDIDARVVENGLQMFKIDRTFKGRPFQTIIVYKPEFSDWAKELRAIITSDPARFDPARERRIDQLLSYSAAEIDAFIAFQTSKI